jgi:hypothetical protein
MPPSDRTLGTSPASLSPRATNAANWSPVPVTRSEASSDGTSQGRFTSTDAATTAPTGPTRGRTTTTHRAVRHASSAAGGDQRAAKPSQHTRAGRPRRTSSRTPAAATTTHGRAA